VGVSIQNTEHLIEAFLPYDCSLNNAAWMCNTAVDDLNLGLGPKIKRGFLQITFP
jgi:hypothetical protein